MTDRITICGARLHNLKNISLTIPKSKLVVLTGVSGSGKSTLGFDILYKEGQRQYLESLGLIPFGMARPPLDEINGLSPSISINQHLTNRSPRSTVGTSTDIYTYLRVLYARLGHRPCPSCGKDIPPLFGFADQDWEDDSILDDDSILEDVSKLEEVSILEDVSIHDDDGLAPEESTPCPHCGAETPKLRMAYFSFNKPIGACPTCTGLGVVRQADLKKLVEEEKSLTAGAVYNWNIQNIKYHGSTLKAAAEYYGFAFDLSIPIKDYNPAQCDLLFYGVESPRFRRHFPGIEPPTLARQGRFEGIAANLLRRYAERITEAGSADRLEQFLVTQTCPDCEGTRLRPESRRVTVNGQDIVTASRLPLTDLRDWLDGLPTILDEHENTVAGPILTELGQRLSRLVQAGVGYLALERLSLTLSAGEAQRLRLASLLASGLSGVLYVLDEPTIGMHPRDTRQLIKVLQQLRDLGNTVLVIEHDLEMIVAADYVVDLGPGGGKYGGQVVAIGSPEQVAHQCGSITGDYLAGRASIAYPHKRRNPSEQSITIRGARQHNLKDITVRLPLGLLVAVTGVAGAGKSSLIFDLLDRAVRQHLYSASETPVDYDTIEGWEILNEIVTIDQQPLRKMPSSNAATYTGIFTPIRKAFAATPDAKRLGFSAGHFSFNVPGGRCEHCQGTGVLAVEMHFMPDVVVPCPACRGRRYRVETLSVQYRGQNISQVLGLTMEEALVLFREIPAVVSRLQVLCEVGLGYLQLGQPATTLSGGEAQRVKLAKELGQQVMGHSLYLLDEPTTGLHLADTARLLGVLQRLVDAGNSVVVVEHNLELVKAVDWVIDLGPEGGKAGGRVVAEGSPETVAGVEESYTGRFLRELLC